MKEPFLRDTRGFFCKAKSNDVDWFYNEPSVATREYEGHLLRLTEDGWQYWQSFEASTPVDDPHNITGYQKAGWKPVYPKVSYLRQMLQVLGNTWRDRNSPYPFVQQFEDAESPFTDEYELGEYWLVEGDPWYLVPVNKAEQVGNVNSLELHKLGDVNAVFEALQDALAPLRDSVYGVIFTTEDGRRTRVRPRDFDWNEDAKS